MVVSAVDPRRPARGEAGIRRGDVIVEVDRKAVNDVKSRAAARRRRQGALMLVRRGDNTIFMAMKKAEAEKEE